MKPKILIFDIETMASTAYIWELRNDYIPISMVKDHGHLLCWAAKWYGEKKVYFHDIREKGGEKECVKKLWDLMNEADTVVAHNGKRFDVPTMNGYFAKFGLDKPSQYKIVDTLQVSRSNFRLLSHKLDSLGDFFGIGRKVVHTGFDLWKRCMDGDQKAWRTMKKYNIQDVRLLESVYVKLIPWIKNGLNYGLYIDGDRPVCKNCGHDRLKKDGLEYLVGGTYQRFRCLKCRTPQRSRKPIERNKKDLMM